MKKKRTSISLGVGVVIFAIVLLVLVGFYFEDGVVGDGITGADVVDADNCYMLSEELQDSIMAWWPGEGGEQALDVSGNEHHGELNGEVDYADGAVGQAFVFDGESGYIEVEHDEAFNFDTSAFTIEGWVRPEELNKDQMIVNKFESNTGYSLKVADSNNLEAMVGSRNPIRSSGTVTQDWHHVAITRNGQNFRRYLDGEEEFISIGLNGISQATMSLYIGVADGPTYYFDGLIDELTIYNTNLESEVIQAIIDAGNQGKCHTSETFCDDNIDNDGDRDRDCSDTDCYSQEICLGESCGAAKTIIASDYEATEPFYGCCLAEECAFVSDTGDYSCLAFGASPTESTTLVCGLGNNFNVCNIENEGDISDDGIYNCVVSDSVAAWTTCTEEIDESVSGNYICEESSWKSCDDKDELVCLDNTAYYCNEDNLYTPLESHLEYYCAQGSYDWVECDEEHQGQGVYNADNHQMYNDNYVCDYNPSTETGTWQEITNCAPCRGERPGECVGSSIIDSTTGLVETPYYDNPNELIGCVGGNECFLQDNNYRYDDRAENYVCGNSHRLLDCTSSSSAFPSDDNGFLCRDRRWDACSPASAGTQVGSFLCSYNADPDVNKWQWFSEFECSQTQKYQRKDSRSLICDGANWLTCEDLSVNDPFVEPEVEVSCHLNRISVEEIICNNEFDDDNDGFFNCDDPDCADPLTFTLGEEDFYEVRLTDEDCFGANLLLDSEEVYSSIDVCDEGTEVFNNRATLCHDDGQLSLESTQLLQRSFDQPHIDNNGLAFVYQESNPKAVSIMLTYDLSNPVEFPLSSSNFAAGQHLMLHLEGEYYMLGLKEDEEFAEENVIIEHLSTNNTFSAVSYPGTNRYVFNVFADRVISFSVDTLNQLYRIEVLGIEEAALSYPFPANLEENYEVQIALDSPRRITGLGQVSICRDDNPADPYQVLLCRDNELELTLLRDDLTKQTFGNREYIFLYELVNGVKQVSIFYFRSCSASSLDYNPFINNLIEGRRVACEEGGNLYLINHPEQGLFNLNSISLTDGSDTYTSEGDDIEISILVPDRRIYLTRDETLFRLRSEPETVEERTTLPGSVYSATIPPVGVLLVGKTELELCNQALYQDTTAANICFAGESVVVSPVAKITVGGNDYILETNGQSGDAKQVTIRRILGFHQTFSSYLLSIDDWTHLTTRIITGDFPVIVLGDSLYKPKATTTLLDGFSLEDYPSGRNYVLREKEELSPITSSGYYVLKEGVVRVEQSLTGTTEERRVTARLGILPYQFLPDDGTDMEISGGEGTGQYLATKLDGETYHLIVEGLSENLVGLRIETDNGLVLARQFAQGNQKKFYLDGVFVEMEISEVNEEDALIKLRRDFG